MKIDTFFKSPLDGFLVAKVDDTDILYGYVLYTNIYGNWIINREEKASGEYKYACSNIDIDYTEQNCFAARALLTYDFPSVTLATFIK